ncbi:MAG: single-stranded DNA-binding protein [Chthoniobacterales bacterium]|nr:single-stranded DNA-binding protein [Chthoniobacterales bacterium]
MSPKEILDTILGYLGFAVQIEEQPGEHGLVLQIYTSDAELLTGPNDETLEDLQYLLNRLIQAQDPQAERVTVDIEHRRAMRNDRLVEKMKQIADLVKERGKPLQTEPLNAYDRWLVHQAFKDDAEIQSWSPDDHARTKRITLSLRKNGAA